MKYINIHSHQAAPAPDVRTIRNLMNPDTMEAQLAKDGLYSIGIHPWHIHPDHWEEDVETVEKLMHHPGVVAIGEAGLDRLTDLPLDMQTIVFKAMVMLSEQAQKPLLIHAVRTHAEILLLHRQLLPSQPWIIHGFNLRWTVAHALLEAGLHLSFGTALLHQQAAAASSFIQTPDHALFLETDESREDIRTVYRRAAELKGISEEELKTTIENNFRSVFKYEGS